MRRMHSPGVADYVRHRSGKLGGVRRQGADFAIGLSAANCTGASTPRPASSSTRFIPAGSRKPPCSAMRRSCSSASSHESRRTSPRAMSPSRCRGSVWRRWSATLNSSNPGCIGVGATARSPVRSLSRGRFQPRRRMIGEGIPCQMKSVQRTPPNLQQVIQLPSTHSPRPQAGLTRPRPFIGAGRGVASSLLECATLGRVDWFNKRRLLAPMGYIPPARAEERYDSFMAAYLKRNSLWQIRGSSGLDRQPKQSDY
jgi:hypothetical protein